MTKHLRRLEKEFLETRTKFEEKTVELENAKTEYRLLRDTGMFTPTNFACPAASLNDDDDDINVPGDTLETMEGVGSGEPCGSKDPIPGGVGAGDMDVGGSAPTQTRAAGELGKRMCLEFVAPSVDLLTTGFGQHSEADCNLLCDKIKRHIEEMEDARSTSILLDLDGDLDASLLFG